MLDEAQIEKLLILCYPKVYRQYKLGGLKGEIMNDHKELSIGRIVKTTYKNKPKYYIYGFQLNENEVYKGEPYDTLQQAKDYRKTLVENRQKGVYSLSRNTYVDFCYKYVECLDVEETTRAVYIGTLNRLFKPFFANLSVYDINRDVLQKFINSLNVSLCVPLSLLKSTVRELYIREIIEKNYCDLLSIPRGRTTKKKRALTIDELNQYYELIKGTRLEVIPRLMFSTGLRIGEAMAITKKDIFIDSSSTGYVTVNKTVGIVGSKRIIKKPKTPSSNRTAYFNDERLVVLLKQFLASDRKHLGERTDGTLERTSYLGVKYFVSVFRKMGLYGFSSHYARVTYASHALECGMSEKNLQEQLGHVDSLMIHKVYAKPVGNRKEVAYEMNIYS